MSLEIEAVYEHGILKPASALPLQEGEKVTLTIRASGTPAESPSQLDPVEGKP